MRAEKIPFGILVGSRLMIASLFSISPILSTQLWADCSGIVGNRLTYCSALEAVTQREGCEKFKQDNQLGFNLCDALEHLVEGRPCEYLSESESFSTCSAILQGLMHSATQAPSPMDSHPAGSLSFVEFGNYIRQNRSDFMDRRKLFQTLLRLPVRAKEEASAILNPEDLKKVDILTARVIRKTNLYREDYKDTLLEEKNELQKKMWPYRNEFNSEYLEDFDQKLTASNVPIRIKNELANLPVLSLKIEVLSKPSHDKHLRQVFDQLVVAVDGLKKLYENKEISQSVILKHPVEIQVKEQKLTVDFRVEITPEKKFIIYLAKDVFGIVGSGKVRNYILAIDYDVVSRPIRHDSQLDLGFYVVTEVYNEFQLKWQKGVIATHQNLKNLGGMRVPEVPTLIEGSTAPSAFKAVYRQKYYPEVLSSWINPDRAKSLAQGPDRKRRKVEMAVELLATLSRMHELDICHRDLKPDNVLLGTGYGGDTVYVADFDTTGQCNEGGANHWGLGTPDYLSPELKILIADPKSKMGSNSAVNKGADNWAMGLTLYEMWQEPLASEPVSEEHDIFTQLYKKLDKVSETKKLGDWSGFDFTHGGTDEVLKIVGQLLQPDMKNRMSAAKAHELMKEYLVKIKSEIPEFTFVPELYEGQ